MKLKKDKNGKIIIERKNYYSEELYRRALKLEKALDKMERDADIKNRRCYECGKVQKKKDYLELYPCLDKWVKVCSKCRKKFSDFAVKQIEAVESPCNYYDAKYKKSIGGKVPEKKIPLPIINEMFWSIDHIAGKYFKDENKNKILIVNTKDGKIYKGKYIGDWK